MSATDQRELLTLLVKLLKKRQGEGRADFLWERAPETRDAVDAIAFDAQGEPIFETISPLARSALYALYSREMRLAEEEASRREESSPVHTLISFRVEITDEILVGCATSGDFSHLAFELYKETGIVLTTAAHCYVAPDESRAVFNRDQAICAGLLVRIVKFMLAAIALTAELNSRDVVLALTRCIAEAATNLRYLVLRRDDALFEEFVRTGLGPERELYDLITRNVAQRSGQVLPIETRMLRTIDQLCRTSAVRIEDIDPKVRDWGGGLRNRLRALNEEQAYVSLQRIPSHAVHGTWVDLLVHHLEEHENGFAPRSASSPVDSRLLAPICLVLLRAGGEYLMSFFGDLPELRPMYARLDDLSERLVRVDSAHERWLQGRADQAGGKTSDPPAQERAGDA